MAQARSPTALDSMAMPLAVPESPALGAMAWPMTRAHWLRFPSRSEHVRNALLSLWPLRAAVVDLVARFLPRDPWPARVRYRWMVNRCPYTKVLDWHIRLDSAIGRILRCERQVPLISYLQPNGVLASIRKPMSHHGAIHWQGGGTSDPGNTAYSFVAWCLLYAGLQLLGERDGAYEHFSQFTAEKHGDVFEAVLSLRDGQRVGSQALAGMLPCVLRGGV